MGHRFADIQRFIANDYYLSTLWVKLGPEGIKVFREMAEACPAQDEFSFNQWVTKQKGPSTRTSRIIEELMVCYLNGK